MMKTKVLIILLVLYLLFGMSKTSKAGVVGLALDYTATAEASIELWSLGSDYSYDMTENGVASAHAYCFVPEDLPEIWWDSHIYCDAQVGGISNSEVIQFTSGLDAWGADDFIGGQTDSATNFIGTITVGDSFEFPFGSPLTLSTSIDVTFWWDEIGTQPSFYWIKIWGDDPENPLVYQESMLTPTYTETILTNVIAGQSLNIESSHYATEWLGHHFYSVQELQINFSITPEPATLLLLGLGAVMLRRRRVAKYL